MTDEELMERLRDWDEYDEGKNNDAREAAAGRIEALIAERDDAVVKRAAWELEAKIAQAKLEKAVEALDYCIKAPFSGWTIAQGYARTILAEIKNG